MARIPFSFRIERPPVNSNTPFGSGCPSFSPPPPPFVREYAKSPECPERVVVIGVGGEADELSFSLNHGNVFAVRPFRSA